MTDGASRQAHPHASPKPVRFAELGAAVLAALLDRDLAAASSAAGVPLTGYFITPEALRLWRLRAGQIAADPQSTRWIARAAVAEPDGVVVGHAGFHGPPDAAGMVEVAYSVDPAYRRQGYATAMLRELLRCAAAEPGIRTVRATISPDNAASLARSPGSASPRPASSGTKRRAWNSSSSARRGTLPDRPAARPGPRSPCGAGELCSLTRRQGQVLSSAGQGPAVRLWTPAADRAAPAG